MSSEQVPPGVRAYSRAFVAVLVLGVVVLVVLAATGPQAHRDAFLGLAVLWGAIGAGAVWLLVAVERRLRNHGH
ncbi:hypothetical protein [Nocardioides iriomotensis]|uniref:Uncharacterized protein n=1 Tax=Nocardioides iriomotensis TaxID=715784 RepID=A0A4Q5ISS2_9ACTN|nr:hypothetical protein [Nocardioides iriomotensis]RYU08830.1 hypothetical protein ETU37_22475 [Nocardioides iriomotensis]